MMGLTIDRDRIQLVLTLPASGLGSCSNCHITGGRLFNTMITKIALSVQVKNIYQATVTQHFSFYQPKKNQEIRKTWQPVSQANFTTFRKLLKNNEKWKPDRNSLYILMEGDLPSQSCDRFQETREGACLRRCLSPPSVTIINSLVIYSIVIVRTQLRPEPLADQNDEKSFRNSIRDWFSNPSIYQ